MSMSVNRRGSKITQGIKRLGIYCMVSLIIFTVLPATSFSLTQQECEKVMSSADCKSIIGDTVWYDEPCIASSPTNANAAYSSMEAGTTTGTMEDFIKAYGKSAYDIGKANGIPYIAIIAQAGIESGWGKSKLTTEANNFFGIKAGGNWSGPVWNGRTREENSDGSSYYTNADFRKYNSPAEGFQGYADFILQNPRYKKALDYPTDPVNYITEIKKAGYATDSQYIATNVKVQKTVDKYISEHAELGLQAQKDVVPDKTNGSGTATTVPSTPSTSQATIYLDPGHSGVIKERDDQKTGIHESLYANEPEMQNVWDVANIAKTKLEQSGYKVVLSKDKEDGGQYNREKTDQAAAENAAIGISLHTDSTMGSFEDRKEVWPQKVGLWRSSSDGKKTTFSDAALAKKSQDYASALKLAMDKDAPTKGGLKVTQQKEGVYESGGKADGNIPLVQLFATTPWVYFEVGSGEGNTGLTENERAQYAEGIVNGIKQAIPPSGGASTSSNSCGSGSTAPEASVQKFQETVLAYAWPDWHEGPYTTRKPEYEAAVKKAQAEGRYVGGDAVAGVDCGGFVTTLLVDSGFIPGYNDNGKGSAVTGGTKVLYRAGQSKWAKENMQYIGSVTSTSELQPGDVAFNTDGSHTFIFVGDIQNFNSKIASASVGSRRRSPMAGKETIVGGDVVWFRRK